MASGKKADSMRNNEKYLFYDENICVEIAKMFYMICFCREGDLLSQWRGYARDGVCLGMDFLEEAGDIQSHTEMFTILNNHDHRESGEELVWLPNKKEGSEVST